MGWCNKPTELQFQSIFITENFDALNALRVNRSRPWNLTAFALGGSLVHRRWHSPSRSSWNIKREVCLECMHHFESDVIKQYGPYAHLGYWTLISDPWPNKVVQKLKGDVPKEPNQAEAKWDCVVNPQNYNFSPFLSRKI